MIPYPLVRFFANKLAVQLLEPTREHLQPQPGLGR